MTVKMGILLLVLSLTGVSVHASAPSEYVRGIFEGFREDPNSNSTCIDSFNDLNQSFNTFVVSIQRSGSLDFTLTSLKDISTKIVSSVDTCEMRYLVQQFSFLFSVDQLEYLTIRIISQFNSFAENYTALVSAFQRGYWFEAGFFTGKILSALLDFTI